MNFGYTNYSYYYIYVLISFINIYLCYELLKSKIKNIWKGLIVMINWCIWYIY